MGCIFFVLRILSPEKTVIIPGKPEPKCTIVPPKERQQYDVYNHILSQEKTHQVVHLLPPDTIPVLSDLEEKMISPSQQGQKTHSCLQPPTQTTKQKNCPEKAECFQNSLQRSGKKEQPISFCLRIGHGLNDRKDAEKLLKHVKNLCPPPKGISARVCLLASKELIFAPFLWGQNTQSAFNAFIQCLKRQSIPYTLLNK